MVIAAVVELVDIPALRRLYRIYTGPTGHRSASASAPTSSPRSPPCSACSSSTRCPACSSASRASLLLLIYRASAPHVAELGHVPGTRRQYADQARDPANQPVDGILIIRPESGLFFANAEHIRHEILRRVADTKLHGVVLDAETMPYIDVTAVTMLEQLADELERQGITLVYARDIGQVRDIIDRSETAERHIPNYPTIQAAVDALSRGGPVT